MLPAVGNVRIAEGQGRRSFATLGWAAVKGEAMATVFIVEDDARLLEEICKLFELEGYQW